MTDQSPTVSLDAGDAAEIAEALTFIADWLRHDWDRLDASLREFVGHPAYDLDALHADLARLAFLLGGDDGERLFGELQP